jgi:hypothetical protein
VVEPIHPVGRRPRTDPPPVIPVQRVRREDLRDEEQRGREERREQREPDGEDDGPGHVDVLA